MTINPMQSAHDAPRCRAKSKRTGKRCRAPAVAAFAFVECTVLAVAHQRGKKWQFQAWRSD